MISKNIFIISLSLITLALFSGCQKKIEGWSGTFHPTSEIKDGFEVQKFSNKEECEIWGVQKVASSNSLGANYMCGYDCSYNKNGIGSCETEVK